MGETLPHACGRLSLLAPRSAPLYQTPTSNPPPVGRKQCLFAPAAPSSVAMSWSVAVNSKREQRLIEELLTEKRRGAKGKGKGAETRPEWTCKCGMNNWQDRVQCRRCGADRPATKGKGKGKARGTGPGAQNKGTGKPTTSPSLVTSSARSKLRKDMDSKWALMKEADAEEEEDEATALDKMNVEEEQDNEEDEEASDIDIPDMSLEDLKAELEGLEQMIVAAQNLKVTAGTGEVSKRACKIRAQIIQRRPNGQRIAHSEAVWQRALKEKEKIDKQVSAMEDKLKELKEKAADATKQEAAAKKDFEALTKAIVPETTANGKSGASATASPKTEDVTQATLSAVAKRLPCFEGSLSQAQMRDMVKKAMDEAADEMKAKYELAKWQFEEPKLFQLGVQPEQKGQGKGAVQPVAVPPAQVQKSPEKENVPPPNEEAASASQRGRTRSPNRGGKGTDSQTAASPELK